VFKFEGNGRRKRVSSVHHAATQRRNRARSHSAGFKSCGASHARSFVSTLAKPSHATAALNELAQRKSVSYSLRAMCFASAVLIDIFSIEHLPNLSVLDVSWNYLRKMKGMPRSLQVLRMDSNPIIFLKEKHLGSLHFRASSIFFLLFVLC
jgi:hypothetical protein